MFATLGLNHVYAPTPATQKFTQDDYKAGVDNMRQVGEIARQFRHDGDGRIRARVHVHFHADHDAANDAGRRASESQGASSIAITSGPATSKFEDLDLLQPGDIGHVHFQDVPDMPRELLDNTTRFIPGDGITPLTRILRKLADSGYAGPLSVELFLPKFQQADPYELAREIRRKAEAVMRRARVI